jgi:adenylate kinase
MKIYKYFFIFIFIFLFLFIFLLLIKRLPVVLNTKTLDQPKVVAVYERLYKNNKYCIIFIGPPYSGKSFLSGIVAHKTGLHNIKIGDILRNMIINNQLNDNTKNAINSGELINDDILFKILINEFNKKDCKNGFILDGFPRTLSHAIFLNKFLNKNKIYIKKIFYLYKNDDVVINNILNKPRKFKNNFRNDDLNIRVIKKRLKRFNQNIKSLLYFYSNKNIPINFINSNINLNNREKKILQYLE